MVELIALFRVIPYILVAVIAVRKGFIRLSLVAVIAVLSVSINWVQPHSSMLTGILGSVLSLLLLLHALDLKPRREVK